MEVIRFIDRQVLFLFLLLPWASHSLAQDNQSVVATDDPILQLYEPREFVDATGVSLQYRLMKPIDYKPGKFYPLVIFLHGAGERGDDNLAQLKHGAREFAKEERRREYPAYVLVPQCPQGKKWVDVDWSSPNSQVPEQPSDSMKLVKAVADSMIENAGIDSTRVYITGLSMGGYGTWDAIARYDRFFAAAAPICGGGDPTTAKRFVDLPIWCFHGAKDPTVKPERSREMIEALKALSGNPKYTEYPEAAHDSWSATYADPTFYRWLFAQTKS